MNQKDKLTEATMKVLQEELDNNSKGKFNVLDTKELNETYSEKLGGDPEDFISDIKIIKNHLEDIDTDMFGSHLAQQMVEEFLDTCNTQINMTKQKFNLDD